MTDTTTPPIQNKAEPPLYVDTELLRPFQPKEPIGHCSQCDKLQARWRMIDPGEDMNQDGTPKSYVVCAVCFLFESRWGKNRVNRLNGMIARVEAEKKAPMLRDTEGKLMSATDADRILAGIALTSRMFSMSGLVGTPEDQETPEAVGEEPTKE